MQDNPEAPPPQQAAPSSGGGGNKAKKLVKEVKLKCTDKVIRVANIASCGFLFVGAFMRFGHSFSDGFFLFFFIKTLYYVLFILAILAIEFNPEMKASKIIRTYFNFLDRRFGRAVFLIFLAMIQCEMTSAYPIMCAIGIIIVAICGMIIGWSEVAEELPSPPWKSSVDDAQNEKASNADPYKVQMSQNPEIDMAKRATQYQVNDDQEPENPYAQQDPNAGVDNRNYTAKLPRDQRAEHLMNKQANQLANVEAQVVQENIGLANQQLGGVHHQQNMADSQMRQDQAKHDYQMAINQQQDPNAMQQPQSQPQNDRADVESIDLEDPYKT